MSVFTKILRHWKALNPILSIQFVPKGNLFSLVSDEICFYLNCTGKEKKIH